MLAHTYNLSKQQLARIYLWYFDADLNKIENWFWKWGILI